MDAMLQGETRCRRRRWRKRSMRRGNRSFRGRSSIAIRMILSFSSVSLPFLSGRSKKNGMRPRWNGYCTCVRGDSEKLMQSLPMSFARLFPLPNFAWPTSSHAQQVDGAQRPGGPDLVQSDEISFARASRNNRHRLSTANSQVYESRGGFRKAYNPGSSSLLTGCIPLTLEPRLASSPSFAARVH
jgi:hypothetical protein